jgi:hypothetical protein
MSMVGPSELFDCDERWCEPLTRATSKTTQYLSLRILARACCLVVWAWRPLLEDTKKLRRAGVVGFVSPSYLIVLSTSASGERVRFRLALLTCRD